MTMMMPSHDQGMKGDSEKTGPSQSSLTNFFALVCTAEKSWEVPMLEESSFLRDSMNVSESDGTIHGRN